MTSYLESSENAELTPVQQPFRRSAWLPTLQQMVDAVQLRFAAVPPVISEPGGSKPDGSEPGGNVPDGNVPGGNVPDGGEPALSNPAAVVRFHPFDLTMRQGLGLVCTVALLAGLLPFIWNWTQAASIGTALPLAQAARNWSSPTTVTPNSALDIAAETAQIVAGLPPRGPAGLAAFLSALGEWLNWPMRWLAVWIVYGLAVAGMALLLGAHSTLQHFYAATSYAFIPLLLGALAFVPVLGWLLGLAGVVWAVVVYFHAARTITGLDTLRMVMSMIAPVALGALAMLLWMMIVANVVWSALL